MIGTALTVVGELWAGVENSEYPEPRRKQLRRLVAELKLWTFDRRAAEEFGRLFALLRRTGRTLQPMDLQIAAIAITLGCTVVTKDSDFSSVPGLTVEDWSQPETTE